MRRFLILFVLFALVLSGVIAAAALAGKGHEPAPCKGNPHYCGGTTTVVQPAQTVTLPPVTVTEPAKPHDTVPPPPLVVTNQTHDHTVVVKTIYRVRVKFIRLRTYCTMQRHGWKCTLTRPVKHRPLRAVK